MDNNSQRFWAWPDELKRRGILGINQRNLDIILECNPRGFYPRVDNKLLTKEICQANGIQVPETYFIIKEHSECHRFLDLVGDRTEFVVKPSSGAAGRGIVVVAGRLGNNFFTSSGRLIEWTDLRHHLSTIISGLYSLGGQADSVIVERRIVSHPLLKSIAVEGTPDIRVILYRGVPVMAMIRLPTKMSGGRANLHQGAIAAAIELNTGRTYGGVCRDRAISFHPDTSFPIAGIELPNWKDVLEGSMKLSDALEMGYVGIDFVVDADTGPVVLEANARPGLAIQLAHREGILPRLKFVDSIPVSDRTGENRWNVIESIATKSSDFWRV
ncbi:alpha-L-glutamate ligase-like protein [Bythopirellula polymerisocia]|uniref:Ribosomal protein S6--L-glutamate ligase n=1 Tax=Bythopirellula polymerisocia TaxID=2528003 RepID=A0A5C6CU89_9BACT|nr:alpha-L-glutamate ligase-like protein [Bythopirellula polymerisocia]TWU28140.1 Ribosomal protein S6--L-glutamate ligase [Bythopirellula polymerisocia]